MKLSPEIAGSLIQRYTAYHPNASFVALTGNEGSILSLPDGTRLFHKDSGPAYESPAATEWWVFGVPHRIDGAAIIQSCISKLSYSNRSGNFERYFLHGVPFNVADYHFAEERNDPFDSAVLALRSANQIKENTGLQNIWSYEAVIQHLWLYLSSLGMSKEKIDNLIKAVDLL